MYCVSLQDRLLLTCSVRVDGFDLYYENTVNFGWNSGKSRMGTICFSECAYTVIRYGDQYVQIYYNCSSAFSELLVYCRKKKPIILLSLCKKQARGKSDSREHIRIKTSKSIRYMHFDECILNEAEFS